MALDPAATSAVWGEGVGIGAASLGAGAICAVWPSAGQALTPWRLGAASWRLSERPLRGALGAVPPERGRGSRPRRGRAPGARRGLPVALGAVLNRAQPRARLETGRPTQLSGTIIRGTLKTPNSQLVTPISIKLQRSDGCD
jgi:hypothetical protein